MKGNRFLSQVFAVVAFLTCTCGLGLSQPIKTQVVVLDHLTGLTYRARSDGKLELIRGTPTISAGRPVQLTVINVNSLKYAVRIHSKDSPGATSKPLALAPFFQGLPIPVDELVGGVDLEAASRSLGSSRGGEASLPAEATSGLATTLRLLESDRTTLEVTAEALAELSEMESRLADIIRNSPDPQVLGREVPGDPLLLSKAVRDKLKSEAEALFERTVRKTLANFLDTPDKDSQANPVDLGRLLIQQERDAYASLSKQKRSFRRDMRTFKGFVLSRRIARASDPAAVAESEAVAAAGDDLEESVEEILDGAAKVHESVSENREELLASLSRSAHVLARISNEDVFQVTGPTVTPRSDGLTFTVQITPAEELSTVGARTADGSEGAEEAKPISGSRVGEVTVAVTGVTKVDYTTGLFATNVVDHSFRLEDDGVKATVIQGPKDEIDLNFGGLMHVFKSRASGLMPALSFGLGSGKGGEMTYMLGASILESGPTKFALTAGIAARQVDRLDGLSLGVQYPTGTDLSVRRVLRTGYFVGLSIRF